MQYAIQTKNLTKKFSTVTAVDSLSIDIPSGSIYGFLGPNGAGKTTTIRLLLGLIKSSAGKASVMGFDTNSESDEIRLRCGALLENTGLYEQMTADDNLEFYARVWKLSPREKDLRKKELLDIVGLWERKDERINHWSRGMKQKLALARTLLHEPQVIFLDEPTAGLDVMAAAEIRNLLENLVKNEGVTVFLTTHNMSEVEKLCDHIAVIRNGKLITQGHPDKLRSSIGGQQIEVYGKNFTADAIKQINKYPNVTSTDMQNSHLVINLKKQIDIAPLINMMVRKGISIEEVRKGKASLEEVFIDLMEEE